MTYYQYNRSNQGRYAKKSIDWTKLFNHAFDFTIVLWVFVTVAHIALKANGF